MLFNYIKYVENKNKLKEQNHLPPEQCYEFLER